ncbi:hypothetical protein [Planotetraspora sp. GP83]|uniref:hypothetical protein n=1 Tax=Planotetraspora sp. GP83 TaxID=3156264 RepID=UPI003512ABF0
MRQGQGTVLYGGPRLLRRPGRGEPGRSPREADGGPGPEDGLLLAPGGGQVPSYAVDLLSHFMSPFKGADLEVSAAAPGPC